jgi:hypothetical protein
MDVTTLPIAPIGATGILAVAILMLLRGALIPRSVHEDRMKDKDQTIEYLRNVNSELLAQNSALMTVGHTAERVLMSLQEAASGGEEEGRREVASP